MADASVWATSPLGVALRRVFCGFFSPSRFCYPLRCQNSPQTCWWESFLVFGKFSSFTTPSPGQVSIPNSFASLFFFYILSYLLLKKMGGLSGACCPLPAFTSCSVEVAQHSNDLLINLWGRKWSPVLFLHHLRTALCHSFCSRKQASLNFMAAITICNDFGAPPNKVSHCFHCFPIYLPWCDVY